MLHLNFGLVSMNANSTFIQLSKTAQELQVEVNRHLTENNSPSENQWLDAFQMALSNSIRKADEIITCGRKPC